MPVIRAAEAVVHQLHGVSFTSYAAPSRGSRELCAWRVDVPAGTAGVAHRVSREEVLYILSGSLQVSLDGEPCEARPGDAIVVTAGAELRLGNQASTGATAWVTTTTGLAAVLPDGTWLAPPWAN
jgi:quercetin dioxygenase-like cupin family protein